MQSLDMLAEDRPDSVVALSPGDIGGQYRTHSAPTPHGLMSELPLTGAAARSVGEGRLMTRHVLSGTDDRLLAVVGPCSIHDVNAGLAYAKSLGELAADLADDLAVVMRVYVEKPRTTVGWTGLLTDPALDGSLDVNHGLRTARTLMLEIAELGLPIATEWLSRYDAEVRDCAERISASGGEVRTTAASLPALIAFDRSVVFLLDGDEAGKAHMVRHEALVEFILHTVVSAWASSAVFQGTGGNNSIGVRTCRKYIAEMFGDLGAQSRFQAGWIIRDHMGVSGPERPVANTA